MAKLIIFNQSDVDFYEKYHKLYVLYFKIYCYGSQKVARCMANGIVGYYFHQLELIFMIFHFKECLY